MALSLSRSVILVNKNNHENDIEFLAKQKVIDGLFVIKYTTKWTTFKRHLQWLLLLFSNVSTDWCVLELQQSTVYCYFNFSCRKKQIYLHWTERI